ncbi:HAMP domain-containing sensor histidine kinase [Desulfovibrio sp. JC010]|uniref:sensor histidine kinase n=1 Tax=Desulfovibrio sp. JC010 TaxID=2593641 RepID=UPI0013D0D901|nr:HAMP domain-containing sensor histidine kinase [Desulfovibrio sp. JC010]
MKFNSLRFKAIVLYSVSLVILLALYGWAQFGTARVTEDEVLNNILRYEADDYFNRYDADPDTRLPQMRHMRAFNDPEQLLPEFRAKLPMMRDGVYETSGPFAIPGPDSHNILVRTYPEGDRRLYLVYDASHVIAEHSCSLGSTSIMVIYFVFTAVLGTLLVFFIGKIIFYPLDSLAGKLRAYAPDDLDRVFSESERRDEVGLLASNIQNSFQRVRCFIKREQEFTRDASHELRTPLSVIKGAMELIRLYPESERPEMQKPLDRIERSVTDMEEIIETLLWIAREESGDVAGSTFCLSEAVEGVVQSLHPLAESKNIDLVIELEGDDINTAPKRAFSIVLSNLLANAFNYTPNGSVGVSLKGSVLTVWDTGMGIADEILENVSNPYVKGENSSGFGLGLSIVQRLCDRFGWIFYISNRSGGGTVVSIDFSSTKGET